MFRKEVTARMTGVTKEWRAARLSVTELADRTSRDPTILLDTGVVHADIRACRERLEDTYLVRLFAVFEESLREIRRVAYGKAGPIQTYQLILQCAARQSIPHDEIENVQAVRAYRNTVVHGGKEPPVQLLTANAWLSKFFRRMPEKW